MKIPFKSKKIFKKRARVCQICKENTYELLDTHRIIHQGLYSNNNCVCLCVKCHRKHHTNKIKIICWRNSTMGKVLHYIDENKKEQFI